MLLKSYDLSTRKNIRTIEYLLYSKKDTIFDKYRDMTFENRNL